jgi:hypothetical protein
MVLFVFAISILLPSSEIPKGVQSNHIDTKQIFQANYLAMECGKTL